MHYMFLSVVFNIEMLLKSMCSILLSMLSKQTLLDISAVSQLYCKLLRYWFKKNRKNQDNDYGKVKYTSIIQICL